MNAADSHATWFLASVTNGAEAAIALEAGTDVIDAKDPSSGALGRLSPERISEIVETVAGRRPVSATIGDIPSSDAPAIYKAAMSVAQLGIDIIKCGVFGHGDPRPALTGLRAAIPANVDLVAVLMADEEPQFDILPFLAESGFRGVMLDTAQKQSGTLIDALALDRLAAFVHQAHQNNLWAGLAGSLRKCDIPRLALMNPDVLGFRGALCDAGRTGPIDLQKARTIRQDISRYCAPEPQQSIA